MGGVCLHVPHTKFFDRIRPIFVGGTFGEASGLPQFIRQRGNLVVSETVNAVSNCRLLIVVFFRSTRLFMRGQVAGIVAVLGHRVGMGCNILELC